MASFKASQLVGGEDRAGMQSSSEDSLPYVCFFYVSYIYIYVTYRSSDRFLVGLVVAFGQVWLWKFHAFL